MSKTYTLTGSYGGFVVDETGKILSAFAEDGTEGVAPEYADHASFDMDEWRTWAATLGQDYLDCHELDITEANVILTDGSVLEASPIFRSIQEENQL